MAGTDDPDVAFVVSGDPPTLQRWTRSGGAWAVGPAFVTFPAADGGPLDPHDAGLAWFEGFLVFAVAAHCPALGYQSRPATESQ